MVLRKSWLFCVLMLSGCTGVVSASSWSVEFETLLRTTNCADVSVRRAFGLEALGRSFPVTKGYDFHGIHRGAAVFQIEPKSAPWDNVEKYPNRSAAMSALRKHWKSRASITYYALKGEEPVLGAEPLHAFEVIEWRGLALYYSVDVGGRTSKEDLIYQLIVRAEGYHEELMITAGTPEAIADIVACEVDLQ